MNLTYLYKKCTISNAMYLQLFEYLKVDVGNRMFFFILFLSFHSFRFLNNFFFNLHTYINDKHFSLLNNSFDDNTKEIETLPSIEKEQQNTLIKCEDRIIDITLNKKKRRINKRNENIKVHGNTNEEDDEDDIQNVDSSEHINISNVENHRCLLFNKLLFKEKNFITNMIFTYLRNNSTWYSNLFLHYSNRHSDKQRNASIMSLNKFIFHKYQKYIKKKNILSMKCLLIKKIFLENLEEETKNILIQSYQFYNRLFFISRNAAYMEKNIQNDFVKMEVRNLVNSTNIKNIKLLTNNKKVINVSEEIKVLMSATRSPILLTYQVSQSPELKNMEGDTQCDISYYRDAIIENSSYIQGDQKECTNFISSKWNNNGKLVENMSYIYKVNDDVRQDKLVIQTIHIFIHILNEYKLCYNLFPYDIATNKFYGTKEEKKSAEKSDHLGNEKISNFNDQKKKVSFSFHLFKKKKYVNNFPKEMKKKSTNISVDSKKKNTNDDKNSLIEDKNVDKLKRETNQSMCVEKQHVLEACDIQNKIIRNIHGNENENDNEKNDNSNSIKKKKKKKKKYENLGAIIEVLKNTSSRHDIGKKFNNIIKYYDLQFSNIPIYLCALKNFISSLAAYSLLSFILQIKDRHNGNLLFDDEGNIIHIDFGYILNIYPGISINFELAPFKLTREMIMLLTMQGQNKQYFIFVYIQLVVKGYLLLREKSDWIISSILSLSHSDINCFKYNTIDKLKKRLKLNKSDNDASIFMMNKIHQAYNNITTIMYDYIQNIQQGIQ